MKQLKLFGIIGLFLGGQLLANTNKEATAYSVDTDQSQLLWTGKKVVGSHNGILKFKSGTFSMINGKVTAAHFVVDMSTIKNVDLKDAGYRKKLEGHLKSVDFFGVVKYPTAEFISSKIVPIPNTKAGQNNYTVYGKLTIKVITQPIQFPTMVIVSKGRLIAEGELTFDRTKFDVHYGSSSFFDGLGDRAIDNSVQLDFSVMGSVSIN